MATKKSTLRFIFPSQLPLACIMTTERLVCNESKPAVQATLALRLLWPPKRKSEDPFITFEKCHERLLSNRSSAQPYLITASVIGRAAPVGGEAHSLAAFIFRRACAGSPVHGHGRGNLVHHSIIPRTEAPLRRFRLSAPDSIEIDQAVLITAKMKITTTHSYQLVGERHWAVPRVLTAGNCRRIHAMPNCFP